MLDRCDPRGEDARSRHPEALDRHRNGRATGDRRDLVVDARDIFTRNLDLPHGVEREWFVLQSHASAVFMPWRPNMSRMLSGRFPTCA